jgi:hypothetical protein
MPPVEDEEKIVTTPDEWEAFYIVRAILREVADPKKVTIRDAQSYCAVLYDDNNRKPICRFYFNSKNKAVGIFDAQKGETRTGISDLTELYKLTDSLKAVASFHCNAKQ